MLQRIIPILWKFWHEFRQEFRILTILALEVVKQSKLLASSFLFQIIHFVQVFLLKYALATIEMKNITYPLSI